MTRTVYLIIFLVILVVGVYYLFFKNNMRLPRVSNNPQVPITTATPNISPSVSESPSPKTDDFTVTAKSFSFSPAAITVNQGDLVRINFKVLDAAHSFVIDGYGINVGPLSANQSQGVQFVADKKGTFPYYCSVDGHRRMGMVGELKVQ